MTWPLDSTRLSYHTAPRPHVSPGQIAENYQLGKSTEPARPTWFTRGNMLTSQSDLTDGAREDRPDPLAFGHAAGTA
jgi:hypothetical protein